VDFISTLSPNFVKECNHEGFDELEEDFTDLGDAIADVTPVEEIVNKVFLGQ
jgi:hypothetical protein